MALCPCADQRPTHAALSRGQQCFAFMQGLQQMSTLDVPIYITETGIADAVGDRRPLWLETYIPEVERAVRDGMDVRGLMYWTLVDNFEVRCTCGYHPCQNLEPLKVHLLVFAFLISRQCHDPADLLCILRSYLACRG